MKKYISPSMALRRLDSESLLAALSYLDGEVTDPGQILIEHKRDKSLGDYKVHSVWDEDEE